VSQRCRICADPKAHICHRFGQEFGASCEERLQLIFPKKKGGHFWGDSGALKHLTNNLTSNKPTRRSGSRVGGGFGVKGCSGGQWSAHQRPV